MHGNHFACIHDGQASFLQSVVPFIESGLAASEPVLIVISDVLRETLTSALPTEAESIFFDDALRWYDAPGRSLTRYIDFWRRAQEHGAPALRIIGEPLPSPVESRQVERWEYFENAVNDAVRDYPFTMMCTYNASLAHVAPQCALVSHPYLAQDGACLTNDSYITPEAYAHSRSQRPLMIPEDGVVVMRFSNETMNEARAFIQLASAEFGLDDWNAFEFVTAAGEAIANAIEHGGGGGDIRLFFHNGEIVCDIESTGHVTLDPMCGYAPPPPTGERGRGIWMMRQLCEWVELSAHGPGHTVRLHKSVLAEQAQPELSS